MGWNKKPFQYRGKEFLFRGILKCAITGRLVTSDTKTKKYTNGKFAAMPANLKDAKYLHKTIGQMYAAIKYGKNAMGSYASQLDIKQRWMIIAYIKKVQAENGGDPFTMGAVAETTPVVETTKEK